MTPEAEEFIKAALAYFKDHPNDNWQDYYDSQLATPCEKIITENVKAKNLFEKPEISAKNELLKASITTDTIEKAFIFGKDTSGNYKTSNIILGASSGAQVDLPPTHTDFTVEGGIHNHTDDLYEVPSAGDIYWFMQNNYQNHSFDYYLVNGAEGSTYTLVITNQTAFDTFPLHKPPSQYFEATKGWKEDTDIDKDYDNVYEYFRQILLKSKNESEEMAMAFIIAKYDMGMGLSKKDANGNFQPIFVKEIQDPNDPAKKLYEKTTDCNLK